MKCKKTELHSNVVMIPSVFGDARGRLFVGCNKAASREAGLDCPEFVQDNYAHSTPLQKLQGLHFQLSPRNRNNLVHCSRGVILQVAVDARRVSLNHERNVWVEDSAGSGAQILVPKWFSHSLSILTEACEVHDKYTDVYASNWVSTAVWNSLGVDYVSSLKGSAMPQDQVVNARGEGL